jgi:hypothetical protein
MTVKHLLLAAVLGGAVGYAFGRTVSLLPPFWAAMISIFVSGGSMGWAIRELFMMRQRKRQLDELIKRMHEYRLEVKTWES